MDELLRRRLVGAAVLLAGAWLLAALLPAPPTDAGHGAGHVVTYDLRTGQPVDLPPLARNMQRPAAPPPDDAEPATPGTAEPATSAPLPAPQLAPPPPAGGTQAAPPVEVAKAPAAETAKAPAREAAKESPKEQGGAKPAAPATLVHPVLKVDESFGEKAPANAWYVQIGSFASETNARGVLQKLYGAKLPALIQTVPQGSKLWYRVRVGPYKAESSAQTALLTIKQKGFGTAKLVKPETSPAPARN